MTLILGKREIIDELRRLGIYDAWELNAYLREYRNYCTSQRIAVSQE